MSDDAFVCEICGDEVLSGERIVRVAAEACESDEVLPIDSLVFAVFHSACVVDTFRSDDCDDVPYVDEAREAVLSSPLCECCQSKISPADEKPQLRVLRGGLR